MKPNTLIVTLKKLFDLLYRGIFICLGIWLLVILYLVVVYPYLQSRRYVPTRHPRVFLDTTRQSTQMTSMTQTDEKGRVILRTVPEGDDFVSYNEQGKEVKRESMAIRQRRADSVERAQPDVVRQERRRMEKEMQQRTQRAIDSVLRHDPQAVVVRTKNGYSIRGSGSGYGAIQIELLGQVWGGRPGFKTPAYWEKPVEEPSAFIRTNSADLQLQFRYSSFTEFVNLPPVVTISFLLSIALLIGGPLRLLWQFRKLFAGFSAGHYFTIGQVGRIWQIGWTFVGLFLLYNLLRSVQYYWAVQYMATRNYTVYPPYGIPILWPTNWLLLLGGLTLLALAQVFLHGLQLERERELTI